LRKFRKNFKFRAFHARRRAFPGLSFIMVRHKIFAASAKFPGGGASKVAA
jgi:hypothetical protein